MGGIKSIDGQERFELIRYDTGLPFTDSFLNRKSLDKAVEVLQRHDPHLSKKMYIQKYVIKFDSSELIEPRLCEDCDSAEHIEGSERCEVSYPKL